MAKEPFVTWTVFNSPTDRPGKFVVRKFEGVTPTHVAYEADTVEPIRDLMEQMGLVKLDRSPEDHPTVVETWI